MCRFLIFFFINVAPTTEIYTLSLHDALPIWRQGPMIKLRGAHVPEEEFYCSTLREAARLLNVVGLLARVYRRPEPVRFLDRKSTRLNSSHGYISYAVFCLKKKNHTTIS